VVQMDCHTTAIPSDPFGSSAGSQRKRMSRRFLQRDQLEGHIEKLAAMLLNGKRRNHAL